MELVHLVDHFNRKYVLECLFPVGLVELLGCVYNIVTIVFGSKLECLQVIGLNQLLEILADHLFVNQELILGNVRDFEKHSGDHIDAIKKLEVDMHVIGYLALHFFFLEFDGLVWNSTDTLCKDLSKTGCLYNIHKHFVAFFNESKAECSKSDLSNSSVVEDLAANVLKVNALADVSLEQQVTAFIVAAVQTVMESLLKSGLDLHLGGTELVDNLY